MVEYTSKIKSSKTRFFNLDPAPEMLLDAAEEGDGRVPHLVVTILAGDGAQMEFVWPNCGPFMDTTLGNDP